jgi:hypothetical protein
VSSAFLYLGIVAIWAFFLVPRWLRRPNVLGGEATEADEFAADEQDDSEVTSPGRRTGPVPQHGDGAGSSPDGSRPQTGQRHADGRPSAGLPSRSRVLQARRRMLTMLVTLTLVAAGCTYLKLMSWWVCIPPTVMLGMYLLLLREAALADAEQARRRMAESRRAEAVRQRAREQARAEPGAQVIDISARLGDQLYDQYEDATIRAVGD